MRHHFPGDNLVGTNRKLIGEVLAKGRRLAEPPHRNHVSLTVEVESTRSELAVEVNRQLWNAKQRPIVSDQPDLQTVARADDDAARQPEVAIKPGIGECTAVHLDAELGDPERRHVRLRLDPEVRAVGVGTDDPKRTRRIVMLGHHPGDDAAALGMEPPADRAGVRRKGPEAGCFEMGPDRLDSVVGRR